MSLINRKKRDRRASHGDSYGDYRSADTRRGNRQRSRRSGFAGPVIIICALVAVLVAADYAMNSGRIHRGVEVGDVSLGGRTPDEAREVVRDRAMGPLQEIEFGGGPDRFTRTASELGVNFHIDATVEKAYAVGRDGNVLERLSERLRAGFPGITIDPNIDYRSQNVRTEVREIATQVNESPQDASMRVVGSEVEVARSRDGYELSVADTMTSVDEAIDGMGGEADLRGRVLDPAITTAEAASAADRARAAVSEQLVFQHDTGNWTISPADIGSSLDVAAGDGTIDVSLNRDRLSDRLANVYSDLTIKPKEASYDFDNAGNVVVLAGREGRSIEWNNLLNSVENGLFEGKREYAVTTTVQRPEYTTQQLEAQKPTELLGSYRTNYSIVEDVNGGRAENLEIASGAVNQTFVAPGEVFSMNQTVQNEDYNTAHVIINGEEVNEAGGGLCQVTSTLYNAVTEAGLDVTERHPHQTQLPYIRPGLDATIWYGDTTTTADDTDMKFRNTSDGYVLLEEYVSNDGFIYANVYGVPNNVSVDMWSEPVYRSTNEAQWNTFMTRTENGEVTYDGLLHKDTYGALTSEDGEKYKADEIPVAAVSP